MAEDTAYIRVVAGSIPARPIRFKKKWLIKNQPNHMHVWSSWFWTLAFQAGYHAGSNPVTCSICP